MSESDFKPAKSNFIRRLWRGELPLWQTYWLFGVAGGLVTRLLSPILTYFLVMNSQRMSAFDISAISNIWLALTLIYSVVVLVGIWKSADKYAASFPAKRGNARLAKVAVFLGVLSIGVSLMQLVSSENPVLALSNGPSVDEKMQYQATISALNADLPKMLDSITQLTKIDIQNGGSVYYERLVTDLSDKVFDVEKLRPTIAAGLCMGVDTSKAMESGSNFTYVYSDAKGQSLGKLVISKSDCIH